MQGVSPTLTCFWPAFLHPLQTPPPADYSSSLCQEGLNQEGICRYCLCSFLRVWESFHKFLKKSWISFSSVATGWVRFHNQSFSCRAECRHLGPKEISMVQLNSVSAQLTAKCLGKTAGPNNSNDDSTTHAHMKRKKKISIGKYSLRYLATEAQVPS